MMQRAVNVEAKVGLRSSTMVWDLDVCCSRGHHLSHNTSLKMQTQSFKNSSYSKKPKLKDLKSAPSRDNVAKSPKKDDSKDKKKKFQGQRWKHTGEWKEQTPAINVNTTNISNKKKKRRDISEITCFNCNKKSHFASYCTKPKN